MRDNYNLSNREYSNNEKLDSDYINYNNENIDKFEESEFSSGKYNEENKIKILENKDKNSEKKFYNLISNYSEKSSFDNKYKTLKEKYKNLKNNLQVEIESSKHWKNSYYNLLKNSLNFDDTIKTLI